MALTPSIEPAIIIAGDTLTWQKTLLDYLASAGWTLNYRLINAAGKIDIVAAANGDSFLITVPAATSSAYAPGIYTWQSYVTNIAGERHTIATGGTKVQANWAAQAAGLETRTTAKQILDTLEAAWLVAATKRAYVYEYRIGGRLMRFALRSEWIAELNFWRREVAREEAAQKIAAGLNSGRKVYVRF